MSCIGHSYSSRSDAGMLGSVLAIVAGHLAAAARDSAIASWFHVACPYSYMDCSSLAHVAAWFDCN
jgi:hypothetical protein